jgi:hypothetical protein
MFKVSLNVIILFNYSLRLENDSLFLIRTSLCTRTVKPFICCQQLYFIAGELGKFDEDGTVIQVTCPRVDV